MESSSIIYMDYPVISGGTLTTQGSSGLAGDTVLNVLLSDSNWEELDKTQLKRAMYERSRNSLSFKEAECEIQLFCWTKSCIFFSHRPHGAGIRRLTGKKRIQSNQY